MTRIVPVCLVDLLDQAKCLVEPPGFPGSAPPASNSVAPGVERNFRGDVLGDLAHER